MKIITCEELQAITTAIRAEITAANTKTDKLVEEVNKIIAVNTKTDKLVEAMNKLASIQTETLENCKTGEVLAKTINKDFDFKTLEIK